jgi:uncharacterized protein (TIGR00159 family)
MPLIEIYGLQIGWREILDIVLVAVLYYRLLLIIRGTRAVPVLYGLVLIVVLYYVSGEAGLYTLNWLLANFLGSIFIVIIILFQSDIRKALAEFGAAGLFSPTRQGEQVVDTVVEALYSMARTKTGAIMVLENKVPLGDYIDRGVRLDARVSNELLGTIFFDKTPLHDGAVIIRGERIVAASCVLPLTPAANLKSELGTRHRAAIGISEESDAIALVVSEERGEVSLAHRGTLTVYLDMARLRGRILKIRTS